MVCWLFERNYSPATTSEKSKYFIFLERKLIIHSLCTVELSYSLLNNALMNHSVAKLPTMTYLDAIIKIHTGVLESRD